MAASFQKFNPFVANVGNGKFNLNSDQINLALFVTGSPTPPTAADNTYNSGGSGGYTLNSSGCTEVANGNGYTANGQQLASTAYSQTSGTATLSCTASATTWTATSSGFSLRYIVCYDLTSGTSSGRYCVGWWDYSSTVTLNAGDTFSVTLASGVLTIA